MKNIQSNIKNTPRLVELNQQHGFPPLPRFNYALVGEPSTALHNKVYPILTACIASLNDNTQRLSLK